MEGIKFNKEISPHITQKEKAHPSFCRKCGSPLNNNSKTCAKCGTSVANVDE